MTETHSEFYERWSSRAQPYFDWQFEQFAPYVGRRVVDVGCGLGSFVGRFLEHGVESYLGVEPDADLRRRLKERWTDARVRLTKCTDASQPELAEELRAEGVDTAFSCNVIEHIERDDLALKHMIEGVKSGGHVCILVPAHQALYGSLDELDNHYRRYDKASMRALVARVGGDAVEWKELYYLNAIGALGWIVKAKLIREKAHGNENFALMNAVLPFVSRAEKAIRPPFGLSLIAVLRKR